MDGGNKYERMYQDLVSYERFIHERNQRRIRIGLRCIIIVPLIFLALLFGTNSNKVVFLILWIASLFLLAAYLIGVEYMDYNLQLKLSELGEGDAPEPDALIGQELELVAEELRAAASGAGDAEQSEDAGDAPDGAGEAPASAGDAPALGADDDAQSETEGADRVGAVIQPLETEGAGGIDAGESANAAIQFSEDGMDGDADAGIAPPDGR